MFAYLLSVARLEEPQCKVGLVTAAVTRPHLQTLPEQRSTGRTDVTAGPWPGAGEGFMMRHEKTISSVGGVRTLSLVWPGVCFSMTVVGMRWRSWSRQQELSITSLGPECRVTTSHTSSRLARADTSIMPRH